MNIIPPGPTISSVGSPPATIFDLRPLHRRVLATSVRIVDAVQQTDLDHQTPCAEWTLAELVAHMIAQHRGFAAAARGDGASLPNWQVRPAADPVAEYTEASAEVLTAFADVAAQQPFSLPEFSTESTFPAHRAISFHLVDYVVHSWDVARSIGRSVDFDDEVLDAALRIADAVPVGAARTASGAAFGPVIETGPAAPTLTRVLALLGRSADWTAP